jgi:hypothetical protein
MSEPENFLNRWSRRKAEAAQEPAAPESNTADEKIVAGDRDAEAHLDAAVERREPPPEIDLSTLPPIETIVAGTDVTPFLRAGVPAALTRAALRRAWAADPSIRDFIGLSENSWDFTAPDGVPGFGPLSPDDASRLMARYSGKAKEVIEQVRAFTQTTEPPQTASIMSDSSAQLPDGTNTAIAKVVTDDVDAANSLQREEENVAMQNDAADESAPSPAAHRTHGSALPK